MRAYVFRSLLVLLLPYLAFSQSDNSTNSDALMLRQIYDKSLTKSECYEDLRYLCKQIGGRLSGSEGLEKAITWAQSKLVGIADTVYLQEVSVPHWFRGEETAIFTDSYDSAERLTICALGGSVGTNGKTLTGKIIEVRGLAELAELPADSIKGRFVFYNRPMDPKLIDTFESYGGCVDQRSSGAAEAAQYGAIGVIVRSMSHKKDDNPHTGVQRYKEGVTKIPAAAISVEDAEWLSNQLLGEPQGTLSLKMDCWELPDKPSYNVIAEIKGKTDPNTFIAVGGHLDSWDNNEGAHDDGAGVVQSMEMLRLIKKLKINNRNTIRCVLFTNEENGARGAIEYARSIRELQQTHIAAIESDRGGFTPRGFSLEAIAKKEGSALDRMVSWSDLFKPYGVHHFVKGPSGVDVSKLKDQGVVCIGFVPDSQRYFDHHHARSDVFEAVNKRELELGAATITALVYLIDKYGLDYSPKTAE